MKIFQVTLQDTKSGSISTFYLDYGHLCGFLDNLPLHFIVTIGLLIDDSVLNNFDYEIQK